MNIIISIEHPAWAHQFQYLIKEIERNNNIKIAAIKKDHATELLDKFNLKYDIVANSTGKNIIQKFFLLFIVSYRIFNICRIFKPDLFIGRASPMMAINSFLYRKPHIIFEDTEHSNISLFFCKLFSNIIYTNDSFRRNLGKKQIRINTYKELFYLHPNRFKPNIDILKDIGIKEHDNYVVIRFVGWHADHDIGHKGLSDNMRKKLITDISKHARIFITSELELPEEYEKYRLNLPLEKIHHLLYFATLLYGESSTMATEAAVLGTHAIFLDYTGRGYTDELEQKYQLVYNFKLDYNNQLNSINKAVELICTENIKETGKQKRIKLLENKIDGTEFFVKELLNKSKCVV